MDINNPEVIVNPPGWDDMVKKYQEKEERQLRVMLAKHKAQNVFELMNLAKRSITTRAIRGSSEHKPLNEKERTNIIREAKSEDIHELKRKLNEEINAIGQRILKELPNEVPSLEGKVVGLRELRGRVTRKSHDGIEPTLERVGNVDKEGR